MDYLCFISTLLSMCITLTTTEKSVNKTKADQPHLKIHFFPVGEGDATIIECNDMKGNVSLTLVNAGSVSLQRDKIQVEYFKFLESKLNKPNYYLKNIIITNPAEKYYNFIEPLVFVKGGDLEKIRFYVAGRRTAYVYLNKIFKEYDNVNEFTRRNEANNDVSSCGHFGNKDTFYTCVKRNKNGPIANSDEVIPICNNFQISVMAANYGFSQKNQAKKNGYKKSKNNLVLKVTPRDKASPSILMGSFEDGGETVDTKYDDYYSFIKDAHDYYTSSQDFPLSLTNGLASTLIKIPQNGALTEATVDDKFYSDFVQPTYAVVSSGISDSHGHPKCEVLEALDHYLSMISPKDKAYQCHPIKATYPGDIDIASNGSNNLYQTTAIDLNDFPNGKVLHTLITFKMTTNEIKRPTTSVIYKIDR